MLLRRLDVTDVARRTLAVAPTGLVPFGLIVLALYLPVLAIVGGVWIWLGTAEDPRLAAGIAQGSILGFEAIVAPIAAGALTAGTFRKLAIDRPPLGLTLKTGLRDGLRALPVGLLAGLCTALAYGACVVPGYVVGTVLFVIGPVLAVERPGLVGAFRRTAELTKGSRWGLFAVILAIGAFQGILGRLVWGVYPDDHTRGSDRVFDLRAHLLLLFVASILVAIARGVASSIAYWDLRGIKENLEVQQLVALVGGRADPSADASVDEMIARAKRGRQVRMGLFVTALGLVAAGIGGYFVRDATSRAREERRIREQVERQISQPSRQPSVSPARTQSLVDAIHSATNKRVAIADAMEQEGKNLYGPGLGGVFSSVGRVEPSKLDLAIIPGVSGDFAAMGCGAALSTALQKSSGAYLAGHCPAVKIEYSGAPLWATALAMTLESRARAHQTETSPLHLAVKRELLAQE